MKLLPLLMLLTLTTGAADYYVATTGNDGGTGAIGDPWLTIYRSTRNGGEFRSAGDTVFIRGGLYSGAVNGIDLGNGIGNSGTPGSPITVKAYPGETVIVTGMNQRDAVLGYPINLKEKSHWTFDGIIWSNNYSGASFTSCTNIILTNCVFTQMPADAGVGPDGSGTNYTAGCVVFKTHSLSNKITFCTITNWGVTFSNGSGNWQTAGSPLIIGQEDLTTNAPCYYHLVENCTFSHCGHDLMGQNAAFCTIRSNLFYNDAWMPTNASAGWQLAGLSPRSAANPIGKWGARVQKSGPGNNDFTDVADGNVGNTPDCRTVWEHNTLLYGAIPVDSNDAAGFGLASRCQIYRYNIIAFCASSGIYFEHSGNALRSPTAATNNPAYFHSDTLDTSYGTNCAMSTLNCIYNNVIYGNGMVNRSNWPLHGGAEAWSPVHGVESSMLAGSSNPEATLINNWMLNNIIWNNSPSNMAPTIKNGYLCGGITWHPAILRTNWDGDVPGLSDPMFVSTNGMGFVYDPTNLPDFHISTNSPCVDSGGWLTTAVGSSNGTVMAVFNSLFFSDGNHMVAGDTIQLQGQTTTVTVVANDWTNNVLTLSAPLTWTDGQGVALAYSGLAPDMGAYETTGFALPRGDLHVINGNIGTFIVR